MEHDTMCPRWTEWSVLSLFGGKRHCSLFNVLIEEVLAGLLLRLRLGIFGWHLVKGEVGVHQSSQHANIKTQEICPREQVVATDEHPDIGHCNILYCSHYCCRKC